MTEWKAGGQAMVDIVEINEPVVVLRRHGDKYARGDVVMADVLRPLPTDPNNALKKAVIDAVGEMRTTNSEIGLDWALAVASLFKAYDALVVAMTPPKQNSEMIPTKQNPDPVEVFHSAAKNMACSPATWEVCRPMSSICTCRLEIAAGLAEVRKMEKSKQ